MGFLTLVHKSDAQVCIFISLHSHCFIVEEISSEIFQSVLDGIDSDEDKIFSTKIFCVRKT